MVPDRRKITMRINLYQRPNWDKVVQDYDKVIQEEDQEVYVFKNHD